MLEKRRLADQGVMQFDKEEEEDNNKKFQSIDLRRATPLVKTRKLGNIGSPKIWETQNPGFSKSGKMETIGAQGLKWYIEELS